MLWRRHCFAPGGTVDPTSTLSLSIVMNTPPSACFTFHRTCVYMTGYIPVPLHSQDPGAKTWAVEETTSGTGQKGPREEGWNQQAQGPSAHQQVRIPGGVEGYRFAARCRWAQEVASLLMCVCGVCVVGGGGGTYLHTRPCVGAYPCSFC
jgi:hypothetical protein